MFVEGFRVVQDAVAISEYCYCTGGGLQIFLLTQPFPTHSRSSFEQVKAVTVKSMSVPLHQHSLLGVSHMRYIAWQI